MARTTTTNRIRRVTLAFLIAVAATAASTAVADAAVSFHGSDISFDFNTYRSIHACDQESDANKVKAGYAIEVNGNESGSVTDHDGYNNICAQGGPSGNTIKRHHTCEKNLLTWNCGNWVQTNAPG